MNLFQPMKEESCILENFNIASHMICMYTLVNLNFVVFISLYKSYLISLSFKLVRGNFKCVMHAPNTKFWLTHLLVCMNFVFLFNLGFVIVWLPHYLHCCWPDLPKGAALHT